MVKDLEIATRNWTKGKNSFLPEERFWEKADKKGEDECWEWKACTNKAGYGSIFINGKSELAHRISYILTFGEIIEDICILHKCDNVACVNPNHLFPGTRDDNSKDMIKKGRSYKPIGEKHPNTELTWEKIREIRERYNKGENTTILADEFGMTRQQMWRIINNAQWQDGNYNPVHNHGNAKIDYDIVYQIRDRYKNGEKQKNLATEFGISIGLISMIISNKRWKEEKRNDMNEKQF